MLTIITVFTDLIKQFKHNMNHNGCFPLPSNEMPIIMTFSLQRNHVFHKYYQKLDYAQLLSYEEVFNFNGME
jgi:hypothetical protein